MEGEGERERVSPVRIHVGGLGEAVTAEELRRLFDLTGGGSIDALHFVRTKGRSFAYVDFSPSSHNSLRNLFAKYNGCVWKGGRLRLEKTKEHYLDRLRREWAEDAAAAAEADARPATTDSSQEAFNLPVAERNNLRIFFPRLRKVKLLPYSGTGKHKYSFQRVNVPSLPKYFCDCEEHAGPFSAEKEKRVCHQEAGPESGGVNQEELSIMNKVMNTLFKKQNDGSLDDATLLVNSGDNSFKLGDERHVDEDEEDEDNLVLNVVGKGNDDMLFALLGKQQGHQANDQETRSKSQPFPDNSKVQKGNASQPQNKKKKSLLHDKSSGNSEPPNKKKKSLPRDKSHGKIFESSISATASEGNLQSHSKKLGKHSEVHPAEPGLGKQQPSADVCYKTSNIEKESLERSDIASTEEDQPRFEAPNEPDSESRHENLEGDRKSEGTTCKKEKEGLAEGQPAESNKVPIHLGRGASWQHKSSWMELISGDTSFSISQLVGGAILDQQLPKEPKVAEIVNSANGKVKEIEKSARDVPDIWGAKQEDDSRTTQAENQQTILGNDKPAVSMLEENRVAANQTLASKVEISDTCSFMRNATSLKEWAKTKAALSGSLKRKRNEQK